MLTDYKDVQCMNYIDTYLEYCDYVEKIQECQNILNAINTLQHTSLEEKFSKQLVLEKTKVSKDLERNIYLQQSLKNKLDNIYDNIIGE